MPLFGNNPEQDALVQSQQSKPESANDESLNVAFALMLVGLVLGLIIGGTIAAFF